MKEKITPVLLGADLNCYNVARAFHEEYGVISHAFGRYAIGATMNSKIVKFTAIPDFDTSERMVQVLNDFAKEHKGEKLIVMGCTDDYVSLIIANKDKLAPEYIAPYTTKELIDEITLKEHFYEYCEKYGIPYPKTKVIAKGDSLDALDFDYPIIVKPSSSVLYWKHEFEGMKKVYRAKSKEQAQKIVDEIYASGYPDKIILQDTIPGNDNSMYVLTSYSDKDANVRMMCLGHVLLEEHTPKGLGNHCAIVTERNDEIMQKMKKFLEDIHFVGYSNFDIKYDSRDGQYKAFEINVRQGRSNYYVTGSGFNVAKYFVEDYIYNKELPYEEATEEHLWMTVPKGVAYKHVKNPEYVAKMKKLVSEGKVVNPVFKKGDLKLNRFLRMVKTHLKQYSYFDKYYK